MKFGMQSLRQTAKSAVCSKIKKLKIQDGRRRQFSIVFLGIASWSTRGPILASDSLQRVLWHKEVPCGVQKDKYFSFHPLKSRKTQIFGHFNAFSSGTHLQIKTANINAKNLTVY